MAKNWKQLKKIASKKSYEALRLYDRDIPEFPYIVEKYNEHFVVWEKGKEGYEYRERNKLVKEAISDIFSADDSHICFKKRLRQRNKLNRYDKFKSEFYNKVQNGFLKIAKKKRTYKIIDSNLSIELNKKIMINEINKIIK